MTRRRSANALVAFALLAVAPACERSTPTPTKVRAEAVPLVVSAATTTTTTTTVVAPARSVAAVAATPLRQTAQITASRARSGSDQVGGSTSVFRLLGEAPAARGRDLAEASAEDPARGRGDAAVTAIIFGDVQCPYTSKAVAALEALQLRVGRDRLRLVWKAYPLAFHRRALPAAEATAAVQLLAGPEAAFRVIDDALAGALDDRALEESARSAGASTESYRFALTDSHDAIAAKVAADRTLAESLGVHSVPEVFIGDLAIRGAASEEAYARAVDDVLARGPAPRPETAGE